MAGLTSRPGSLTRKLGTSPYLVSCASELRFLTNFISINIIIIICINICYYCYLIVIIFTVFVIIIIIVIIIVVVLVIVIIIIIVTITIIIIIIIIIISSKIDGLFMFVLYVLKGLVLSLIVPQLDLLNYSIN